MGPGGPRRAGIGNAEILRGDAQLASLGSYNLCRAATSGATLGRAGVAFQAHQQASGSHRLIGALPVLSRVVATREAHLLVPRSNLFDPGLRATRTAGPSLRVSGQKADDFGIRGEPANRLFGKGHAAVYADLERTPTRPPQCHLRIWPGLAQQIRRRTGARFIVSLAAVFDFDPHPCHPVGTGDHTLMSGRHNPSHPVLYCPDVGINR